MIAWNRWLWAKLLTLQFCNCSLDWFGPSWWTPICVLSACMKSFMQITFRLKLLVTTFAGSFFFICASNIRPQFYNTAWVIDHAPSANLCLLVVQLCVCTLNSEAKKRVWIKEKSADLNTEVNRKCSRVEPLYTIYFCIWYHVPYSPNMHNPIP